MELVNVASLMLSENINLLEEIRKICSLRFAVGEPNNEVFLPIRGIESETDSFPMGEVRENWDDEFLKKKMLRWQPIWMWLKATFFFHAKKL